MYLKRAISVLAVFMGFFVSTPVIADEDIYAPEGDVSMIDRIRMEAEFIKFLEKMPTVVGIQSKDDYLKNKGTGSF